MPRLLDPVNYPVDRFANYQLSDATANAKGAKSCKLESNGAQVIFNLGERPTPAVSALPVAETTLLQGRL